MTKINEEDLRQGVVFAQMPQIPQPAGWPCPTSGGLPLSSFAAKKPRWLPGLWITQIVIQMSHTVSRKIFDSFSTAWTKDVITIEQNLCVAADRERAAVLAFECHCVRFREIKACWSVLVCEFHVLISFFSQLQDRSRYRR